MSLLRWKKGIGEDTFIVCEVSFHGAPLMFAVWLQYAAFEEIDTKDYDRARDVYKAAVKLVPHKTFTFAKVSRVCPGQTNGYLQYLQLWLAYAYFEIRRLDVSAARKVLGAGIGMCPKPKLFTGYIELEMRLREFDRVRTLYEKFLTVSRLHSFKHVTGSQCLRSMIPPSVLPGSNGLKLNPPSKISNVFEQF